MNETRLNPIPSGVSRPHAHVESIIEDHDALARLVCAQEKRLTELVRRVEELESLVRREAAWTRL